MMARRGGSGPPQRGQPVSVNVWAVILTFAVACIGSESPQADPTPEGEVRARETVERVLDDLAAQFSCERRGSPTFRNGQANGFCQMPSQTWVQVVSFPDTARVLGWVRQFVDRPEPQILVAIPWIIYTDSWAVLAGESSNAEATIIQEALGGCLIEGWTGTYAGGDCPVPGEQSPIETILDEPDPLNPAEAPSSPEEAAGLLLRAWLDGDKAAAYEVASEDAADLLLSQPVLEANRSAGVQACSMESSGEYLCTLTDVSFWMIVKETAAGYLVDRVEFSL